MSKLVIHDGEGQYDKCFYVKLLEGLPYGVHNLRITLHHPNGWTHHHQMQFLDTGCSLWVYGDLRTKISAEIDGMQVPAMMLKTTQHRNLYNLVTRLLSTGPRYKI